MIESNTSNLSYEEQKKLYDQAWQRGWSARNSMEQNIVERQEGFLGKKSVSTMRFLEGTFDTEAESIVKLNPNTTPEHKAQMMEILERIRESEAKSRKKRRKKSPPTP